MDVLYYSAPYPDPAGNRVQLSEPEAKARGRYNRVLGRDGQVLRLEAWDQGELLYVEYPDIPLEQHRQVFDGHHQDYPSVRACIETPVKDQGTDKIKLRNTYSIRSQQIATRG